MPYLASLIIEMVQKMDDKGSKLHSGDCANFAKALASFLDIDNGRHIYCAYENDVFLGEGTPSHCALEYQGRLYDGDGLISHGAGSNLEEDLEILRSKAFNEAFPEDEDEIRVIQAGDRDFRQILDSDKVAAFQNLIIRIRTK